MLVQIAQLLTANAGLLGIHPVAIDQHLELAFIKVAPARGSAGSLENQKLEF